MKEKLLAALKLKFKGVQDAVLDRIATKKAETVKEESEVQTVVDGLTTDDLINSEADFRSSQSSLSAAQKATQKAVTDYEKKHNLKDGKVVETPDPKNDPVPKDAPDWAKNLIKSNELLQEQVRTLSEGQVVSGKVAGARVLLDKSKVPENYRDAWLKRIDVNDEENSIEDQIKGLEDEYLDIEQAIVKDKVAGGHERGTGDFTDKEMDEYLEDKKDESAESEN